MHSWSCQHDNTRAHVPLNMEAFFHTQHVWLFLWPACSPNMPPIEYIFDYTSPRLADTTCRTQSTTELWHHIEVVWNAISQHDIQNFYDSMPWRVRVLSLHVAAARRIYFRRYFCLIDSSLYSFISTNVSNMWIKLHSFRMIPSWRAIFTNNSVQ